MYNIVILILFLTVLTLMLIQTVTVRIDWERRLIISIDYMFFTILFPVKKDKNEKKKKKSIPITPTLVSTFLSHSRVCLHRAIISFASDDCAEAYITDGAIRSVLFPTLSTIGALSKEFSVDDGAIKTQITNGDVPSPHFDISFKLSLFHMILSLFSFWGAYLKKKKRNQNER